eukprot:357161-Chlamydomonas_euryale.AAC.5
MLARRAAGEAQCGEPSARSVFGETQSTCEMNARERGGGQNEQSRCVFFGIASCPRFHHQPRSHHCMGRGMCMASRPARPPSPLPPPRLPA